MKALQGYKFTFNNDFMMNRELNFNVTRNNFGHVLICLWMTLFLRVSYCGQFVEINFVSVNLLKIVSFPSRWVIMKHSSCVLPITILWYTSQSRKFEKSTNIHQDTKSLRRKSLTPLQKQPPEVFYKKALLNNFVIFRVKQLCWSLFLITLQTFRPATLLKRNSNTGAFLWILRNL